MPARRPYVVVVAARLYSEHPSRASALRAALALRKAGVEAYAHPLTVALRFRLMQAACQASSPA